MRVRVLALAVTLLFVATPFATTVCDAMCAQRAGAHHAGQGHACCHDEQATGAAMHTASVNVICGVPAADSVTAVSRAQDEGRGVLLPSSMSVAGIAPVGVASSRLVSATSPPTLSTSASQLRI